MSVLPYYLAIVFILCIAFISISLVLDLFDMRCWMHHTTDFLEQTLKNSPEE